MSLLEIRVGAVVLALLALIALRGKRWAYLAFVVLGLLYFPAQTHWRVHVPKCQLLIPTTQAVVASLQNYAQNWVQLTLFAGVCWMSWVQFRRSKIAARAVWAVLATMVVGALVEVAEGVTTRFQCRVRDLVPVAAAALAAALLLAIWARLTRKPGYVRIVKPRPAVASRQPAPAPRPAAPPPPPQYPPPPPPDFAPTVPSPRVGTPPRPAAPPPSTPARGFPAAPADFTPTPGGILDESGETTEVVPAHGGARTPLAQRLQAIRQRLVAMLQRLWAFIRGRRRTAIVASVLLVGVAAAAFYVLQLQGPAPTVAVPEAAPPPPPRRLQSEAEGYYEPDYQFSIANRRFTRLTLQPEAFLTFSLVGSRQEAGCADARIGQGAVYLRCEVDRVGVVTIDGRFPQTFTTSRLDAPVLSALITITSARGEVLYRAHDSFRWHEPD